MRFLPARLPLFLALCAPLSAAPQDVSTSFEFTDQSGAFTLGVAPRTVTFLTGAAQTVGVFSLYHSGFFAWMMDSGETGTIVFDQPAAQVDLFLRTQFASVPSTLTVFGTDGSVLATVNGTNTAWTPVNVASTAPPIGSITVDNQGMFGWVVVDDFASTAYYPFGEFCSGNGGVAAGCTPCPCGNDAPAGTVGGCRNSSATSARLIASGIPSAAADTLRMEVSGANPSTFGILTSGIDRLPSNAANPCFGLDSGVGSLLLDGLRCVGGNVLRHGSRASDATGSIGETNSGWGPPNGPVGGLTAAAGLAVGQTRYFQVFYRENVALGCGRGQNTSQGVSVTAEP